MAYIISNDLGTTGELYQINEVPSEYYCPSCLAMMELECYCNEDDE